jgi:hypothetical protein
MREMVTTFIVALAFFIAAALPALAKLSPATDTGIAAQINGDGTF